MRNCLYILFLLTIFGLTACTQDFVEVQDRGSISSLDSHFDAQGKAYLRFDIALPSTTAHSRATTFDDGNEDEYRVDWNHSYLILFAGDGTPDGTHIASCYRLDNAIGSLSGTTTDQITSEYQLLQTISKSGISEGDKLYAYVLLNAGDQLLTATIKNHFIEKLTLNAWNGSAVAPTTLFDFTGERPNGMKLKDFLDLKIYYSAAAGGFADPARHPFVYTAGGHTYFTMANAYMATAPGGNSAPTAAKAPYLLAQIDPHRLYDREEDAHPSNPAAYVYVERAVGKVNITVANSMTYGNFGPDDEGNALTVVPLRWTLLNAGRLTYLTKRIDGYATWSQYTNNDPTGDYRFVEAEPAALLPADYTYAPASYRISWAESPTYDADKGEHDLFRGGALPDPTDLPDSLSYPVDATVSAYPLENTFDVGHMTYQNTTGVVVKARVKAEDAATDAEITNYGITVMHRSGSPDKLFTLNRLRYSLLLWMNNAGNLPRLSQALATEEWTNNWFALFDALLTEPVASDFYAEQTISRDNLTMKDLNRSAAGTRFFESRANADAQLLNGLRTTDVPTVIEGLYNCPGGRIEVDPAKYPNDSPLVRVLRAYIDASIDYLEEPHSNLPTFGFYRKGVMYYRSLIRHFSDTQAPWNKEERPQPTLDTYPSTNQAANYLGRYGVVRNNWYQLQINSFKSPGDIRVYPFNTADPDDRLEQHMPLQMYLLPWTLRENHFYVGNPYDNYNQTQP